MSLLQCAAQRGNDGHDVRGAHGDGGEVDGVGCGVLDGPHKHTAVRRLPGGIRCSTRKISPQDTVTLAYIG